MSSLFRREAAQQLQQRLYGEILLARPPSFKALTLLFAALAAALIAFVVAFGFTRKEVVSGVIVPSKGLITLTAPQGALVAKRLARDGQTVKAGQPIYELSLSQAGMSGGQSAQELIGQTLTQQRQSLQNEVREQQRQGQQRQQALSERAALLGGQLAQLDQEIALAREQVQISQATAQRFSELAAQRYVAVSEVQQRQSAVLEQSARLEALRRQRLLLEQERMGAKREQEAAALSARREATTLSRQITALGQEQVLNQSQQRFIVRAPVSGQVTALSAEEGQALSSGQPLGSIVPAGAALEAEVYAPSSAVGFIQPGMEVLVRYHAFPYQKFGQYPGKVREVSAAPLAQGQLPQGMGRDGAPVYRIRIALDQQAVRAYGQPRALRPGMTLEASLVLEKRKVYEWILDPLYSITGKM